MAQDITLLDKKHSRPVLVLERDPVRLAQLKRQLQPTGLVVFGFSVMSEAAELLADSTPVAAILGLDPLDGTEADFLRYLREVSAPTQVYGLIDDPASEPQARSLGIAKTFRRDALPELLREIHRLLMA